MEAEHKKCITIVRIYVQYIYICIAGHGCTRSIKACYNNKHGQHSKNIFTPSSQSQSHLFSLGFLSVPSTKFTNKQNAPFPATRGKANPEREIGKKIELN